MYRIGFIVEQVLGHKTHSQNLRRFVEADSEIDAAWGLPDWDGSPKARAIPLYRSNWTVQAGLQARKALAQMNRRARLEGVFIHTQVPAILAQDWLMRIPGVVSLDATPIQYDSLGEAYEHAKGPAWLEQLKWRINRDCFRKAKNLVTWSDWVKVSLVNDYGIEPEKIHVIPPGVDVQAWGRSEAVARTGGAVKVLFVGGDLKRKGGLLLLEAVRELRAAGLALELHLVTREELADEAGVFVYNWFGPNSSGLIDLYHRCDIFCLPTMADCLPMVLSEAGAAGLPILSTRIAAVPELVQDGITGLLAEAGDQGSLTRQLRRLVEERELRLRFGAEARRLVSSRYDAQQNAARLLDLIKRTIDTEKP